MTKRTDIILLLLLLTAVAAAQNREPDAATVARIRKGVEESASRTTTITAAFSQVKEMSILEEKLLSSGIFFFKKEKKLRWEYVKPYSYTIVISNDLITLRDENKTSRFNAGTNKVFSEVNRIIVGSIRGTLLSDVQQFRFRYEEGKNDWIVKLTPLSETLRSTLREITLHFSKKDFSVDALEMTENNGDKTFISFTDKKYNEPIADEKFILR